MNDRIQDLLDFASDDEGRPLGFTPASVAAAGRVARRRRTAVTGFAAAGTLVAVTAAAVFLAPGDDRAEGPQPRTTVSDPAEPTQSDPTENRSLEELRIIQRCAEAEVPSFEGTVEKSGEDDVLVPGATPSADRPDISSWQLDAYLVDRQGTTATFVAPDLTMFAVCDLYGPTVEQQDELSGPIRLRKGPVPDSWRGPEGFRHQDGSPAWAQVCTSTEGKVCGRELFHGGYSLRQGVADIRVDAPDGTVLHPELGDHTFVLRHVEDRVDADRAANDMQPLPSMPITMIDAAGAPIIRYDLYPSYVVPDECLQTAGGC